MTASSGQQHAEGFAAAAARAYLRRRGLVTEPVPEGPWRGVAFAVVRVYNADMMRRANEIIDDADFPYRVCATVECRSHPGWFRLYLSPPAETFPLERLANGQQ